MVDSPFEYCHQSLMKKAAHPKAADTAAAAKAKFFSPSKANSNAVPPITPHAIHNFLFMSILP